MRVVIVGNGVAGIEAALVVREREPAWGVTLVSEESDHFFSRTALMWVLSGQLSHRCIEPYERDLYERLRFERVRARAVGVDVERHEVRLAAGLPPLAYDRLLLACGSRPRAAPWPGRELCGVGHFVTLQDLEWLDRELSARPGARPPRPDVHEAHTAEGSPYRRRAAAAERRRRPSRSPAVVGGGLIGIEAVEVMHAAGLHPRFFVREDQFWPVALDAAESRWITDRLRGHGVEVHLDEAVERLEGDGDGLVARIVSDRGGFEADCVVVAIGVVPNTDWLEGSEIVRGPGGAIEVDAGLATNAPDVLAAGDCAGVLWWDGSRRPEQLWYTARDQGRVAGRALVGDRVEYRRGTWYNSAKLMDVEWTQAGLVHQRLPGEKAWFYEERGAVRSTTRIVHVEGRVVGFNLLGRRWDHSVLARFIEERRTLAWTIDHLHEASFDTELVPPLRIPAAARAEVGAPTPP